jgi:uncharacterized phage-associated protein
VQVSAHDAAAAIRDRQLGVDVAKVHKLLYYAQGLHLAWSNTPLFSEAIEAWERGPVVADLWHDENKGRPKPPPTSLDEGQLSIVEGVLRLYGSRSAAELIRMTHTDGGPWCQVTEQEDDSFLLNSPEISRDLMRSWFRGHQVLVAHRAEVARLTARHTEVAEGPVAELVEAVRAMVAGN